MASTVRRTREERRRSDGTRRSVLHEVSRTVVKNGEIGDVNWNARGDLLEAPITILRVQKGDLVVDRVVVTRPPSQRSVTKTHP